MADIDIYSDWKVDPFSGTTHEESLEEVHLIGEIEATPGVYGIVSHQAPYFPGSIGTITAVQVADAGGTAMPGGTTYTEVSFSVSPASDEFRVDYIDDDIDTFFATGRFNFNSSEDGNYVKINYDGIGSILKGRYVLNSVSTVPTNLAVIGQLLTNIDGPQTFNILDPGLDKHFFDDSDANITYGTNGTDGKVSLEFTGTGAGSQSLYKINGTNTYITAPEGGSLSLLLHIKKNSSLVAGGLRISIFSYDKSYVYLGSSTIDVSYADLNTSYKWYSFSVEDMPADTVYYRIALRMHPDSLAGKFFIDWVYGGDISTPIAIMNDIMSGSTEGHWWPAGQVGHGNTVWLDSFQQITLTTSAANYLITDSERFGGMVKSILMVIELRVVASTGAEAWFYQSNSGTTRISFGVFGNLTNTAANSKVYSSAEVPVSYFSSGQAGIRAENGGAAGSVVILYTYGLRLK